MNADPLPHDPTSSEPLASAAPGRKELSIRLFGVGNAGGNVLRHLLVTPLPGVQCLCVNTDAHPSPPPAGCQTLVLQDKVLRALGTGGDPDRGQALAEDHYPRIQELCQGADIVFVVAGLGGGAGSGISPVIARAAKEAGALVLAFVMLPFACEGRRRAAIARTALDHLRESADGIVTLPNQRVFQWIDENVTVRDTFRTINDFVADGLRGFWRLIVQPGLIEIRFPDLAALLRDRHSDSVFAVAEAFGPTRSREAADKLLSHPMLENGRVLREAEAVLVSLTGGPDLTMAEVNRIMQSVQEHCAGATLLVGAGVDDTFQDRLAVTLIAAHKADLAEPQPRAQTAEQLDTQLLSSTPSVRPSSRLLPPPPTLAPDQVKSLLESRPPGGARKRPGARFLQTQLPLEIVSKGRFDKSEPTIHKGEDLDVPTYIRRGVSLN